jgi:hypothetical protein
MARCWALAALFTEDAVMVTDTGPLYGREAIEKYQAENFQEGHRTVSDRISGRGHPTK